MKKSSYYSSYDSVNDTSGLQNQIADLQQQAQYFQQQLSRIGSSTASQAGITLVIRELDKQITDLSGYMFKQFDDLKKYLAAINKTSDSSPPAPQALQALASSVSAQIKVLKDSLNSVSTGAASQEVIRTITGLQSTISEMNKSLTDLQSKQSTITSLQNDINLLKIQLSSGMGSSGGPVNSAMLDRILRELNNLKGSSGGPSFNRDEAGTVVDTRVRTSVPDQEGGSTPPLEPRAFDPLVTDGTGTGSGEQVQRTQEERQLSLDQVARYNGIKSSIMANYNASLIYPRA